MDDTEEIEQGGGSRGEHQNIARIALVLSALAKAGTDGLRLADLVKQTGLSKTVVHRCLAGLVAHGLATLDEQSAQYFLGDRILSWAHDAGGRFELANRIRPYLERLAEATGDTAYLLARRGTQIVCLGRVLGSYPVKMLSLSVGGTRAISNGAGGIAILAALPPEEAKDLVNRNADNEDGATVSPQLIWRQITQTRKSGFARTQSVLVPGMAGIAVAIKAPDGTPIAALSISAVAQRFATHREQLVVSRLKDEAQRVEAELGSLLLNHHSG